VTGFRIDAGAAASPVILHVPHASRHIPVAVRDGLLLDDPSVRRELDRMTDAHTDLMAGRAATAARLQPWGFVNLMSRLVIDPERFPDEREDMLAVGMGAVYTRTSDGASLRAEDDSLLRWYWPYGEAMTDLVDQRLAAAGRAVIVDVHSYPRQRLPYERGGPERPEICLGTDADHTPPWLADAAHAAFAAYGRAENTPFAGCYVPLKHYGRDPRVSGIMIEIRRDLYLSEPGGPPTAGLDDIAAALTMLVDHVSDR
jgi:N-formylglutamate amidohydrolase